VSDPSDPPDVDAVYARVRAAVGAGTEPASGSDATAALVEVAPGIRAIALRTPTLPPATHTTCYLVGPTAGPGPLLVVDPATPYPDQQAALLDVLAAEAAAGRGVTAVVLTHHHRDHVGAAVAVARAHDAPVWAHAATAARLPDIPIARALAPDDELAAGGGRAVRMIFTPGHAPGHLCVLDPDSGAMIAGDMVAGLGTILIDPSEGDMAQYLASLEAMLALAPRRLLPAHGPMIDDAPGKLREYLAHRRMREAKVLAAVGAAAAPAPALVARAYDDTPRALWPLAERSLVAHLVKLVRDGRVVEDAGGWRRA
jgi:glyoxylase-like metal-dependent hydrolase (beta-lactamase superfamily II)